MQHAPKTLLKILSMAHLLPASDGILILENDVASSVCSQMLTIPRPSLNDMNSVFAKSLAG
jgi:hypothetical protein